MSDEILAEALAARAMVHGLIQHLKRRDLLDWDQMEEIYRLASHYLADSRFEGDGRALELARQTVGALLDSVREPE